MAALLPLVASAQAAPLVADGGFEQPAAPTDGFSLFTNGQSVGGWTVVGAPGGVGIVHNGFTQNGFSFVAYSGQQYLDLTGQSDTATGIAQTVRTTPGATYTLSFAVGNTYDPGGIFGTSTTVRVLVDGSLLQSVTNSQGRGSTAIQWQPYVLSLLATRTTTTIAFVNDDPPTDTASALDGVSLTLASADDRSSIASSLASPGDALGSLAHDAAVVAVAAAATLFITFPAHLFNHTFQENYDEIATILERRLRVVRAMRAAVARRVGKQLDVVRAGVVVAIGALLGGLLDPSFGVTVKSVYTYVSMVITAVVLIALGGAVTSLYRRVRGHERQLDVVAFPAGLLVAGTCVIISRLSSFQPGYLYGVIAALVFAPKLSEREDGQLALCSAFATLAVAVLAWGGWSVVNRSAAASSFPLVVVDDVLAAIFVGGLTGTVITLLPVRFLPGGTIASWSRAAWSGMFILALSGLTAVLLWPNRGGHPGRAPLATVMALLVIFGGASVGMWWYFQRRRRRSAET